MTPPAWLAVLAVSCWPSGSSRLPGSRALPAEPPVARQTLESDAAARPSARASESSQGAALERRIAAFVSEERAVDHVRQLVALGPRMGGTESGAAAAAWRLRAFERLGLTTEVIEGDEAWVHSESAWALRAHLAPEEPSADPAGDAVGRSVVELSRAWPYGFSPSGAGRIPLSLEPARGQALLAKRSPRRPFADHEQPQLVLVDGQTTPGGAWPAVRHLPRGKDNPAPVFGLCAEEGETLRRALAAGGTVEIEYALTASIERARPRTVVARLAARAGAPPGFLLFCAHGDSDAGGPGANDNGSGEAIVVEIASAWSRAVREGLLPSPPREVRFAIWGSEIASTRHYLKRLETDGESLLGVINFDQAGYGSGADVVYLEPDELPGNRELLRCMLQALAEHAGQPGFPQRWATNPSQGGTDSYVFSDSRGFRDTPRPALTLYASAWDRARTLARSDLGPDFPRLGESWNSGNDVHVDFDEHYHSAGDLPENTTDREPWNMAWISRVALLGARRWLNTTFPPPSTGTGPR